MLGPLFAHDGHLSGWISVHYVDGAHVFSADDESALDRARADVLRLTGIGSSDPATRRGSTPRR